MMEIFYKTIEKSVKKVSQEYPISGWTTEDWEQESYIFMYNLLLNHPYLSQQYQEFCKVYDNEFRKYIYNHYNMMPKIN